MTDTALKPCHQGDRGDLRVVQLSGATLTAATSARCLLRKGTTTVVLDVDLDNEAGTATIHLGDGDDDWLPTRPAVGAWSGQIEVTYADGSILTWPNEPRGSFALTVLDEIEPAP